MCQDAGEELSKYAQHTCEKYPFDIVAKTIKDLQEPTIATVTRPTPVIAQTATTVAVYNPINLKDYVARLKKFEQPKRALKQKDQDVRSRVGG